MTGSAIERHCNQPTASDRNAREAGRLRSPFRCTLRVREGWSAARQHPKRCRSACYDAVVRTTIAALIVLVLGASHTHAADPPPLARARAAYNAANYDVAIEAATTARKQPASADAAALVLARAYVERFRTTHSESDLAGAREALHGITPARLSPRE